MSQRHAQLSGDAVDDGLRRLLGVHVLMRVEMGRVARISASTARASWRSTYAPRGSPVNGEAYVASSPKKGLSSRARPAIQHVQQIGDLIDNFDGSLDGGMAPQ